MLVVFCRLSWRKQSLEAMQKGSYKKALVGGFGSSLGTTTNGGALAALLRGSVNGAHIWGALMVQ